MMDRCLRTVAAAAALLTVGFALVAWGLRLVGPLGTAALGAAPGVPPAERLVLTAAGLGLAAVGAWLCLGTLVCVGDLVRRTPTGRSGALRPRLVRRALLGACAPTLGAVVWVAGPVAAETGDLGGLPLPERPVLSAAADRPGTLRGSATPVAVRAERTVRPGECLWTIAADLLPSRSSPSDVDRAWRQVYRVNRARIGPDPDLVQAGTRLLVPRSLRPSPNPSR
jgi:hypothetical protein